MTHWVVEVQVLSSTCARTRPPGSAMEGRVHLCRVGSVREAVAAAVDAALGAVRLCRRPRRRSARAVGRTRNGRVDTRHDTETEGIGVRVLVERRLGLRLRPPARRQGRPGCRPPRGRVRRRRRVARRPRARAARGHAREFRPPMERDPFDVSLEEKVALCLRAEEALRHPDMKVALAMRPRPPRAQGFPLLRRRGRSTRSSSSAAAASTSPRSATAGPSSSGATRAHTSARARRPAGSTSRARPRREGAPDLRPGRTAAPRRRMPGRG